MYNELYAAWQREIEDASLGGLPSDFFVRIADYLKRIAEENLVLEKKSLKVALLEHEALNVKRMLEELVWLRYDKLVKTINERKKVPSELLSVEEAKICESFVTFSDAYQKFADSLLKGQVSNVQTVTEQIVTEPTHKRVTLRFTKSIPSIIGADMKTYGPFLPEDVASVPTENAKILVKQGLAVIVEVS